MRGCVSTLLAVIVRRCSQALSFSRFMQNDILDYSALELQRIVPVPRPTQLKALVNRVCRMFQGQVSEFRLCLSLSFCLLHPPQLIGVISLTLSFT